MILKIKCSCIEFCCALTECSDKQRKRYKKPCDQDECMNVVLCRDFFIASEWAGYNLG